MLTIKYIGFNWLKIYKIVLNKEHLTNNGLDLIKRYKNNLNRIEKQI